MMKASTLFIIPILLVTTAYECQTKAATINSTVTIDPVLVLNKQVQEVSIKKLLANPERYNGKRVIIRGFLNLAFENDALYQYEEDYKHGIIKTALWVNLNTKIAARALQCNKNYVVVEAVFDGGETGHMDLFRGGLKDLTRIEVLPSR
jgi:hypothetical protein